MRNHRRVAVRLRCLRNLVVGMHPRFMDRIPATDAERTQAGLDQRLTISIAEAAFILEVSQRVVERFVATGSLNCSGLRPSGRVTVASLESLVDLRVEDGVQSLLARWALQQIVERRLHAPRASSPAERPPPLLDAVSVLPLRDVDP